jgi:hypothetical protein
MNHDEKAERSSGGDGAEGRTCQGGIIDGNAPEGNSRSGGRGALGGAQARSRREIRPRPAPQVR